MILAPPSPVFDLLRARGVSSNRFEDSGPGRDDPDGEQERSHCVEAACARSALTTANDISRTQVTTITSATPRARSPSSGVERRTTWQLLSPSTAVMFPEGNVS